MTAREVLGVPCLMGLALVLPVVSIAEPIEWPVSEGGNGHYYELLQGVYPTSWADQYYAALALWSSGWQGHLVTITSYAEDHWIRTHLLDEHLPHHSVFYIGGWNEGNSCSDSPGLLGAWHWITGETWDYEGWAYGEPNSDANGYTSEFALSYLYYWSEAEVPGPTIGFNNLSYQYPVAGASMLVEYDGLSPMDVPACVEPVATRCSTWGGLKALYR